MTKSVARSLGDSWASCKLYTTSSAEHVAAHITAGRHVTENKEQLVPLDAEAVSWTSASRQFVRRLTLKPAEISRLETSATLINRHRK